MAEEAPARRQSTIFDKAKDNGVDLIEWEDVFDADSGQTYYFNRRSRTSVWERPPDFVNDLAEWEDVFDVDSGQTYYFNRRSRTSVWERPPDFVNYSHPGRPSIRAVQDKLQAVRLQALRGALTAELVRDENEWRTPNNKLVVFVSSTFTDTARERNVLLEKIQPELREQGRADGIDVVLVDMRWGVRDQNTQDHQTWIACKRELERCHKESAGLFFLSLQGDKYGYRPLPREIGATEFEAAISRNMLTNEWYKRDSNSGKYVLKSLTSLNEAAFWDTALPTLRDGVLSDAEFGEGSEMLVGQSVTEWEARFALSLPGAIDRSFWLHRHFDGGVSLQQDPKKLLDDRSDRITALKDHMRSILGDRTEELFVTADSFLAKDAAWDLYLAEFEARARSLFAAEMDAIKFAKRRWAVDGCGVGLPGEVLAEMLHHVSWACAKLRDFEGREAELERAEQLITIKTVNKQGVSLAIVGKSGAGKTAFLSKLAQRLGGGERPIVIRYCGTSDGSTTGMSLLQSLCRQLEHIFGLPVESAADYKGWVARFDELLAANAVVVLIDSIDQLSNDNEERSGLSFLRRLRPHPDTRVIVSCLPDETDALTGKRYYYGCDTRLRKDEAPRLVLGTFGESGTIHMVRQLLARQERGLSVEQWGVVGACGEQATALYCRMAVRLCAGWRGDDDLVRCVLPSSVPALTHYILDGIELEFGGAEVEKNWTRVALACLTFSRAGLSDGEMQDLLSLDDENVLNPVFQYFKPDEVRRFPLHVWLRLKGALSGLLAEREGGCFQWYHRQLRETAEARYMGAEKQLAHELMSCYFGDLCGYVGESRLVARQPLTLNGARAFLPGAIVNTRRCVEAPYHLVAAGSLLRDEACRELCSVDLVSACAITGQAYELLKTLLALDIVFRGKNEHVNHYMRWLLNDAGAMHKEPQKQVVDSCFVNQPLCSMALRDMERELARVRESTRRLEEFSADDWCDAWMWSRVLGGKRDFDAALMTMQGKLGWVTSVAFSPDGRRIVSGSTDDSLRVLDAETGAVVLTLRGHIEAVLAVAYSSDGRRIVSGSEDNSIRLWDAESEDSFLTLIGHKGSVTSVAFSPDGHRIVTGSEDKSVFVWDSVNGNIVLSLSGHESGVTAVAFSPNGLRIVSGSKDNSLKLWDAMAGVCILDMRKQKDTFDSEYVTSVAFSPDGRRIVSGSSDASVRMWDTDMKDSNLGSVKDSNFKLREYVKFSGHSRAVRSVAFSCDGHRIVSGSEDKSVRVWDVESGECVSTLAGHSHIVMSVGFSPDGHRIVSGSSDMSVRVWDAKYFPKVEQHSNSAVSVAFSPDGRRIVSGSYDASVRVWDAETGDSMLTLRGHLFRVNSAAFSPNGLCIVSGSEDRTLRLWDAVTGVCIFPDMRHYGGVNSAVFSNDGCSIVSGSDDGYVGIWDAHSGMQLGMMCRSRNQTDRVQSMGPSDRVRSVAFSPDDLRITSGSTDGSVCVWDVKTCTCLLVLGFGRTILGGVRSVAFSPRDGLHIVAGYFSGSIYVWDIKTSTSILHVNEHKKSVTCVAFSPNGRCIVSGSEDNTVRVWDASTGFCVITFEEHSDNVTSVAFSHDGGRIVSGSKDNSVRIWTALSCSRHEDTDR